MNCKLPSEVAAQISGRSCYWIVAMLFLVLAGTPVVSAQDGAALEFSAPEAIQRRLQSVEKEMQALPAETDLAMREQLLQLQTALYQHLEAATYRVEIHEQARLARVNASSWKGFDTDPPYSIELADNLRAQQQSLEQQRLATASRLRIIKRAIDENANDLAEHQRIFRKYQEEVGNAKNAEDRQAAESMIQQQELNSRFLTETAGRLQTGQAIQQIQAESVAATLELVQSQIQTLRGKVRFTRPELDETLDRIARERSAVLKTVGAAGNGRDLSRQVAWRLDILDIERDYWTAVHTVMNSEDHGVRKAAVAVLRNLNARVDDWVELIQLAARDFTEQNVAGEIDERVTLKDVRRVVKVQNQLQFALEQLGEEGVRDPSLLDRVRDAALVIWGMEIYLAEETELVGGHKVMTYRAVTLGKLLRLAFILTVGWFLLRFLSRRVHAFVAGRPNVATATANTTRDWTFRIGLALLILIALNRVHIPFTAFAFVGGTLAIGIGFGAQTLLKNFISGVILSLERPFQIGDLVEVDTILGYIQRIGLRASVIRHFDGTDTLVPNSSLLENRVSNYTYGDTAMRGEIRIGVAYGSNTREVARALLLAAEAHGLVLKKPEPSVQFMDFGDNTLNFRLLYWFDATKTGRDLLASDLRFMIDKAFAEAGIVIAFAQRDIHFDDSKPLRVELSRSRAQPLV